MYKLTHEYGGVIVTFDVEEGATYPEMLDTFRKFLNGTGYIVPMGNIEIKHEHVCSCKSDCDHSNSASDMFDMQLDEENDMASQLDEEFSITTLGRYKTREGIIINLHTINTDGSCQHPCIGNVEGDIVNYSWEINGNWLNYESHFDIIEKIDDKQLTDLE